MTYFRRYELPPTSGSDSEVVIKLLSTTLDLWSPVFHSFLVPPWKKSKDSAIKKFYFSKFTRSIFLIATVLIVAYD